MLLRPIEALHQPFESLQCAAEPRQGAFRRSYYYTLFIIYLIRCCVFPTSDLRRLSSNCISDRSRMLNGVPTQEREIFRTRRQLSQKRQQCVWSTARTLYLPAGLHAATSLQPSIFVRWMHFKVLLLRERAALERRLVFTVITNFLRPALRSVWSCRTLLSDPLLIIKLIIIFGYFVPRA